MKDISWMLFSVFCCFLFFAAGLWPEFLLAAFFTVLSFFLGSNHT